MILNMIKINDDFLLNALDDDFYSYKINKWLATMLKQVSKPLNYI